MAAAALGENRAHLKIALLGNVAPCQRLRERLPELLGIPIEKLFTAEASRVPITQRARRVGTTEEAWGPASGMTLGNLLKIWVRLTPEEQTAATQAGWLVGPRSGSGGAS